MKGIYFYYIVMLLSALVGLAKTVLYAKILNPAELGHYSLYLLLSTYGIYICSFGLYEGSLGVFPLWYGKGRTDDVELTRNRIAGFTVVSTSSLIISLGIFTASYPFNNFFTTIAIFLTGLLAGVSTLFVLLLADIRSRMMTFKFGLIMLVRSILSIAAGALSARHYGYVGILGSEVVITAFLTAIVARYSIHNFSWNFSNFATLKPLLRVGLPLMLNGFMASIASNIDRFFVIAAWGSSTFGHYSFAMIVATGGSLVQSILYQHIGPGILYRIGQGSSPKELLNKLDQLVVLLLVCLIVFLYPFSSLVHWLMHTYFPEYRQASSILPIIYVGASIMMVSHYETFVVALGKTEYLVVLNVVVVAIISVLLYLSKFLNLPLMVFASVYVIGRSLYFIFTLVLARWAVKQFCLPIKS